MKRPILAFAVGLVVWVLVSSVLNRALRVLVLGYAAAEPTMSFTLGMLTARLVFLATLIPLVVLGSWLTRRAATHPHLWRRDVSL